MSSWLLSMVTSHGHSSSWLLSMVTSPGHRSSWLLSLAASRGHSSPSLLLMVASPGHRFILVIVDGHKSRSQVYPGYCRWSQVEVTILPGYCRWSQVEVTVLPGYCRWSQVQVTGLSQLLSVVTSPGHSPPWLLLMVTAGKPVAVYALQVTQSR